MDFKPLTLDDIEIVNGFLQEFKSQTCDFSVGGMFMWRDYYKMQYSVSNGVLFTRLCDKDGLLYYNLPISENIELAISQLISEEKKEDEPVRFCTIPEKHLEIFTQYSDIRTIEHPDFFDYLYDASDLVKLGGKKFSGQRNQISQFKRNVESWAFVPLSKDNISETIEFFYNHYHVAPDASEYEMEENRKVAEVLQNYERYKMFGGVLCADNQIVGFSLGEIIGDVLFDHIEKADRDVKGAYQMLVNQFASYFVDERVKYINREEDIGDPGLRNSKRAYHPICLLKKYTVEVR